MRVGTITNVKAELPVRRRVVIRADSSADNVIWRLPRPVKGSKHGHKYRLAHVVDGVGVLRYDYGAGRGDHRHWMELNGLMFLWIWPRC